MLGKDLIEIIKKQGESKRVIIKACGACEGVYCHMERDIDDIRSDTEKIIICIDVDGISV